MEKFAAVVVASAVLAGTAGCAPAASAPTASAGPVNVMVDKYIQGSWTCEHFDPEGRILRYTTSVNIKEDHTWTFSSKPEQTKNSDVTDFKGNWTYRSGTIVFSADTETPVDGGGHTVSGVPEILQMISGQPLVDNIMYARTTRGDKAPGPMTLQIQPSSFEARYTDSSDKSMDFLYKCKRA